MSSTDEKTNEDVPANVKGEEKRQTEDPAEASVSNEDGDQEKSKSEGKEQGNDGEEEATDEQRTAASTIQVNAQKCYQDGDTEPCRSAITAATSLAER